MTTCPCCGNLVASGEKRCAVCGTEMTRIRIPSDMTETKSPRKKARVGFEPAGVSERSYGKGYAKALRVIAIILAAAVCLVSAAFGVYTIVTSTDQKGVWTGTAMIAAGAAACVAMLFLLMVFVKMFENIMYSASSAERAAVASENQEQAIMQLISDIQTQSEQIASITPMLNMMYTEQKDKGRFEEQQATYLKKLASRENSGSGKKSSAAQTKNTAVPQYQPYAPYFGYPFMPGMPPVPVTAQPAAQPEPQEPDEQEEQRESEIEMLSARLDDVAAANMDIFSALLEKIDLLGAAISEKSAAAPQEPAAVPTAEPVIISENSEKASEPEYVSEDDDIPGGEFDRRDEIEELFGEEIFGEDIDEYEDTESFEPEETDSENEPDIFEQDESEEEFEMPEIPEKRTAAEKHPNVIFGLDFAAGDAMIHKKKKRR